MWFVDCREPLIAAVLALPHRRRPPLAEAEMLDAQKIVANIVTRISWVYDRPLMYGVTTAEVEVVLECLHSIWSMCLGRDEQYRTAMADLHRQLDHHAMNSFVWYAQQHPRARDEEIAAYVVWFFKRLDASLGLTTTLDAAGKPEPTDAMDSR